MTTESAVAKVGDRAGGAQDGARAQRLTLSQIVEKLLERGGGEHSSVTLSRNAKGETQIEVVVRTAEQGDVQTAADAATVAQQLYDTLRARYPMSSGFVGASGGQ